MPNIQFYTTIATVIPVFLVAYLVSAATLLRNAPDAIDKILATIERHAQAQLASAMKAAPELARLRNIYTAAIKFGTFLLSGRLRSTLVFLVTVVGIACPAYAEFRCLRVIARMHADHTDYVWAWIGVAVSGGAALLEVMVTAAYISVARSAVLRALSKAIDTLNSKSLGATAQGNDATGARDQVSRERLEQPNPPSA